jgi:hypothetical protein
MGQLMHCDLALNEVIAFVRMVVVDLLVVASTRSCLCTGGWLFDLRELWEG